MVSLTLALRYCACFHNNYSNLAYDTGIRLRPGSSLLAKVSSLQDLILIDLSKTDRSTLKYPAEIFYKRGLGHTIWPYQHRQQRCFNGIIDLGVGKAVKYIMPIHRWLLLRLIQGASAMGKIRHRRNIPGVRGTFEVVWVIGQSLAYLSGLFFFTFLPSIAVAIPSTIDYGSLLFGSAVIWSIAYYVIWARKIHMTPLQKVETATASDY